MGRMALPPSLLQRPGALLTIAARSGQELARRRLTPLGLTVQLCGVLNLLAEGAVSQQELGEQLGIDRTTVTELMDQFEEQGVVDRRRNPVDRRAYRLHLTPKGKTVQKRAARAFDGAADEFFSPLTGEEQRMLTEMLRRLIISAQQKMASAQS
jgi:DNA-binding MarR family transcriptional regulator